MNGQKAGYSVNAVAQEKDGAVTVTEDAHFRVSMMGTPAGPADLRQTDLFGRGRRLALIRKSKTTTLYAHVEGDSMILVIRGGRRRATETKLPKPKESLRDALKQRNWRERTQKVGDQLAYSYFEPMYKRNWKASAVLKASKNAYWMA